MMTPFALKSTHELEKKTTHIPKASQILVGKFMCKQTDKKQASIQTEYLIASSGD